MSYVLEVARRWRAAWPVLSSLILYCPTARAWGGQEIQPLQPPQRPRIASPTGGWVIEFEEMSTDPDDPQLYRATGRPVVTRGADRLVADEMTFDTRTQDATATGNVTLTMRGMEIHAQAASYNLESRQGRAVKIRTIAQGNFVLADSIEVTPERWTAQRAIVTQCHGATPHWSLFAQRVEIVPNQRWSARGVGFNMFGTRLITVSQVGRTITDERAPERELETARQFMPTFGHNRRDGFYVQKDVDLITSRRLSLDANILMGTGRLIRGSIDAGTGGLWKFVASLAYRRDAPNQRAPFLEYNQLPEIGVVYSDRTSARSARFLPTQLGHGNPTGHERSPDEWRFAAQLSAGFFEQQRGDGKVDENVNRDGTRMLVQARVTRPRLRFARGISLDDLRAQMRQSLYDTGDTFLVAGIAAGKNWKLGPLAVGVERLAQYAAGQTPFLFDDVDIRQEWRLRARLVAGGWKLGWVGRYSIDREKWFDHQLSLAKRLDCLEPRIGYDTRRAQITFDIRLIGLEPGFEDPPLQATSGQPAMGGPMPPPAGRKRGR